MFLQRFGQLLLEYYLHEILFQIEIKGLNFKLLGFKTNKFKEYISI